MSEARGGIGSVGLVADGQTKWVEPEEPEAPAEPAPAEPAPADIFDGAALIAEMLRGSEEIQESLEALVGRITERDAESAQVKGQVSRLESILAQYNTAFQQLDAKMNALAQQVVRNTRYAALDLATKTRSNNERGDTVIKNAEAYLEFLTPSAPETPPEQLSVGAVTH